MWLKLFHSIFDSYYQTLFSVYAPYMRLITKLSRWNQTRLIKSWSILTTCKGHKGIICNNWWIFIDIKISRHKIIRIRLQTKLDARKSYGLVRLCGNSIYTLRKWYINSAFFQEFLSIHSPMNLIFKSISVDCSEKNQNYSSKIFGLEFLF